MINYFIFFIKSIPFAFFSLHNKYSFYDENNKIFIMKLNSLKFLQKEYYYMIDYDLYCLFQ